MSGLPRPTRLPASRSLSVFQRTLLRWYRDHQRPLPWRKTNDPYKILVSEIMLQQTQVDRVIPKYHEFLRRYPTIQRLAQARIPQVKKLWYPLGYNIRPVRLRNIAQTVVRRHDGRIPNSYDGLVAMDGIGRYTAGAVLSFAFRQDAPIVDTNVDRLLRRYFNVNNHNRSTARRRIWELARLVIPPGKGYDINQAMMDFGALICTAKQPKCATCALRRGCASFPFTNGQAHAARASRHRGH